MLVNHDEEAISLNEVIEEFRKPETYKVSADIGKIESNI